MNTSLFVFSCVYFPHWSLAIKSLYVDIYVAAFIIITQATAAAATKNMKREIKREKPQQK